MSRIRSGGGKWPGLAAHHAVRGRFHADAQPQARRQHRRREGAGRPVAPAHPRSRSDPWWKDWFAAAGVPTDELAKRPGSSMGAQAYEASAAMAGHGVAILTRRCFSTELADGRLIQPFDLVGDDGHAYWLVYPRRAATCRRSALSATGCLPRSGCRSVPTPTQPCYAPTSRLLHKRRGRPLSSNHPVNQPYGVINFPGNSLLTFC